MMDAVGGRQEARSSRRESLTQTVRRLRDVLDHKTRRAAGLSIALALLMAVIEAAGFGLLYPLLQALSAESAIHHGLTGKLYEFFGSPSYNSFLLGLAAAVLVLLLLRSLLGVVLLKWQNQHRGELRSDHGEPAVPDLHVGAVSRAHSSQLGGVDQEHQQFGRRRARPSRTFRRSPSSRISSRSRSWCSSS